MPNNFACQGRISRLERVKASQFSKWLYKLLKLFLVRGVKSLATATATATAGLQFLHPALAQPRSQTLLPVKTTSNHRVSHICSVVT